VPVARTINALWNDLDHVATLRTEYRDIGEAGVLALAHSDLLFANCEIGLMFAGREPPDGTPQLSDPISTARV
jgi:hypothetical protein